MSAGCEEPAVLNEPAKPGSAPLHLGGNHDISLSTSGSVVSALVPEVVEVSGVSDTQGTATSQSIDEVDESSTPVSLEKEAGDPGCAGPSDEPQANMGIQGGARQPVKNVFKKPEEPLVEIYSSLAEFVSSAISELPFSEIRKDLGSVSALKNCPILPQKTDQVILNMFVKGRLHKMPIYARAIDSGFVKVQEVSCQALRATVQATDMLMRENPDLQQVLDFLKLALHGQAASYGMQSHLRRALYKPSVDPKFRSLLDEHHGASTLLGVGLAEKLKELHTADKNTKSMKNQQTSFHGYRPSSSYRGRGPGYRFQPYNRGFRGGRAQWGGYPTRFNAPQTAYQKPLGSNQRSKK